jgi:glycosyltransferase involved in cell wall biosynthesis
MSKQGRKPELKALFVSQYYPPETGAAATRISDLAEALKKKGHTITVVTEFPNYPKGIIADHHRGKFILKERHNGIDVVRTFVIASERGTLLQRMLFYLSFMFSAIFGGLLTGQQDIIVATSPPLFVALSGYVLSLLKRCPFVFEVRDIWPESAKSLEQLKGKFLIWISEKLELFLYRRSRRIIVVTRGFVDNLIAKGVPPQKISLVSNGVDVEFFKIRPRTAYVQETYGLTDKFVVSYTGNMGLAQGIDAIVECATLLRDEQHIVFMLIGDGVVKRENEIEVKRRALENVVFVDTQPKNEILTFLSVADVCLVPLKKTQLFQITVPSKLYESMACGKPVVLSVNGEARGILEKARAGIFVEPENSEQMAQAILKLYQNPELLAEYGRNGRKYVVEHFSRKQQADILESVLLSISQG